MGETKKVGLLGVLLRRETAGVVEIDLKIRSATKNVDYWQGISTQEGTYTVDQNPVNNPWAEGQTSICPPSASGRRLA